SSATTSLEANDSNPPSAASSAATIEEAGPQDGDGALNDDTGDEKSAVVAVIRQHNKPNKRDISEAFKAGSNAAARVMTSQVVTETSVADDRPLTVFTRFEVSRIKIKNESGTVTLKLTEPMSLEQGRLLPAKTVERELAIERQSDNGSASWVIS